MEKKIFFKNNLGLNLSGILTLPEQNRKHPCVIICHGIFSSKDSSTCVILADKLKEQGAATFRFDFMAHGESEGAFEDITVSQGVHDLASAVEYVSDMEYIDTKRLGIFGRSHGGNVALRYLAGNKNIVCASLNAPASDWVEILHARQSVEALAEWERKGYASDTFRGREYKFSYSFYLDVSAFNIYELSKNIQSKVLIVHGDADTSVPLHQSERLIKQMGGEAELVVIPGADHDFNPEKKEEAVELSASFFKDNLCEKTKKE